MSKKYPVILGSVISIHALRKESDLDIRGLNLDLTEFLSTLSARRATARSMKRFASSSISIHALRKESDVVSCRLLSLFVEISIHALRKESDVPKTAQS